MVDIYDNLEDYEEISNYEQLKSENQELKLKLDQCEAARRKLQQDFDKLATEHNLLLQNFSSLLKTARAEVERKTDTITHINAEKDKLFLTLMSDSTNKVNPRERSKSKIRKQSGPVEICDLRLDSRSLREVSKEKDDQLEREQNPSIEHQTLIQTKPEIKAANSDHKVANKHNKENEVERKQDTTVEKILPCNIKNRRKSMPVLRHELQKFGSEEENEITSNVTQKLFNQPGRAVQESERSNKVKHRPSDASNIDGNCSDTRQLGSKARSQTKSRKETVKDKHVRQSRYDVHETYKKEESNKEKLRLKERRGRSSYGRLGESRHRSHGSYRESEDFDYRQEYDRHASPSYDKYHRRKSRERRSYRDIDRDQSNPNFDRYKLTHHEKPKKTHRDKGAEIFEHNGGRKVETYHDKPDDIADQHKQSRKKVDKDDCSFDRNEQIYEKHERSLDGHMLNSNKKLAEKDESNKLRITQVNMEIPLRDKFKKYKIPKQRSEKHKQDFNKEGEKYDHAIDKYNATSNGSLAEQDDFDKSVEVHQEIRKNPVDLTSPKSRVNPSKKHHDSNLNDDEHNTKSAGNPDYEDSHKLTHRERLAKKHDYDLERNLKTHLTLEEHDFDTNEPICDETSTEELISRRNRPLTVFDRRMTRHIGKQSQHTVLVDLEEPVSKRRKTNLYRQTDEVYCHENVTVDVPEKAPIEFGHYFGFTSCQSPDQILADNVTAGEPMREIMNTAETKLEDPRYTSNRYVTVGDTTSKIRLSVSSRHVHMYKLSWPLDMDNKGHHISEHTGETKSTKCNRKPTDENRNQNKSYERSQEINPKESEIEKFVPTDNNVLNVSLESGEIEDVYSDLVPTAGPNESTEQTDKPQISQNFGIQRKDDIFQSTVIEEMLSSPCDISRKNEIPKISSEIVNGLQNKDSSILLQELLKPSSSNCSNIHNRHPVGQNTELSSCGVSNEPENLKTRSEYTLNVPILQDSPMPLAELFKPLTTDDIASNKQNTEILVEYQHVSSSETCKNYTIPKKPMFEKNLNAPYIKEPQIANDCSSNKQICGPHAFSIKPQKCNKMVTNIISGANTNKHNKSDALQLKVNKNPQSRIIDTPAKKLLVQGDLELSDEDSDNCDLHSQNTIEKLKICVINDEIKISEKVTTIIKSKEFEQKLDKTGKEKENSRTTDINAKLSDLFGETSLITPEDLELHPERVKENFSDYALSPICEFAEVADCNPVQVHVAKTNKSEKIRTRSSKTKKDSGYDKKTHRIDDKKSRKVSESTTDKITEKSEKHILPKKRKNDVEKTKKASTENASLVTIDVDAIKVIPENNDNDANIVKTVIISSGKQPPLTSPKNNEPIILVTEIADDSMKALATSTPARIRETNTLPQNTSSASVDKTIGNDTSAQSMTNHVPESTTTENAPDVRIFITRRKRKRVSK